MSEAQHTPGPLAPVSAHTYGNPTAEVTAMVGNDRIVVARTTDIAESEANARRLAHCWNCHDDLLTACEGRPRQSERRDLMPDDKAQHTPGLIELRCDDPFYSIYTLRKKGADDCIVESVHTVFLMDGANHETCPNLKRLVACWNACVDFSTEMIENGVVVLVDDRIKPIPSARELHYLGFGNRKKGKPHA